MQKSTSRVRHVKLLDGWKLVGYVGVDSGTVMVCDPCYLPAVRPELVKYGEQKSEWSDNCANLLDDPKHTGEFSYRGACATAKYFGAGQLYHKKGHIGAGVVSDTLYGDGVYPVYAKFNNKGRVLGLCVSFDGEPMPKKIAIPRNRSLAVKQAKVKHNKLLRGAE